jgi:hypothetical protein
MRQRNFTTVESGHEEAPRYIQYTTIKHIPKCISVIHRYCLGTVGLSCGHIRLSGCFHSICDSSISDSFLSYHIIPYHHIRSYPILSYHITPYHHISSYPTLSSHLFLSYPILSSPFRSYPIVLFLPALILSYPIITSVCILSYPLLSYLIRSVTHPVTDMSTKSRKIMFLGSKERPARKAHNFTAICEPIFYKVCGPLHLTNVYASSACYWDCFPYIT